MAQEYPSQDQYPTLASSENFEIWDDVEDDVYIISFNANGVTIAVEHDSFDEFVQVLIEAQRFHKSQMNGGS